MPGAPLFSGEVEGMFSLPAVPSGEGIALSIGEGIGVAVMALTALAGFFHYARVGRNEVGEEDERRAEEEARHE